MSSGYEALTAWGTVAGAAATLTAVIVALALGIIPLRKQRAEKKAEVESLREQLAALLYPIMVKWQDVARKQRYSDAIVAVGSQEPQRIRRRVPYSLKQEDRDDLVELRGMYAELGKLTTKERGHIKLLYHRMSTSYQHERLEYNEVTLFEKSIRDILNEMGRFDAEGKFKA